MSLCFDELKGIVKGLRGGGGKEAQRGEASTGSLKMKDYRNVAVAAMLAVILSPRSGLTSDPSRISRQRLRNFQAHLSALTFTDVSLLIQLMRQLGFSPL